MNLLNLDIAVKFGRSHYYIHSPFSSVRVFIVLSNPSTFPFIVKVLKENAEGMYV